MRIYRSQYISAGIRILHVDEIQVWNPILELKRMTFWTVKETSLTSRASEEKQLSLNWKAIKLWHSKKKKDIKMTMKN